MSDALYFEKLASFEEGKAMARETAADEIAAARAAAARIEELTAEIARLRARNARMIDNETCICGDVVGSGSWTCRHGGACRTQFDIEIAKATDPLRDTIASQAAELAEARRLLERYMAGKRPFVTDDEIRAFLFKEQPK